MRALLQRVTQAAVQVDGKTVGEIGPGLLVFLGVKQNDTEAVADWVVNKTVNLRIFTDDEGLFNLSALDVEAELLVISQFTLYGICVKGRRPSFSGAARPEEAERLYEYCKKAFTASGLKVQSGIFGADMKVSLINDGPVTLTVEKES